MIRFHFLFAVALAAYLGLAAPIARSQALGTAFTYQGELQQSGAPADGSFDFRFRLFNASSGGTQIGPSVDGLNVPVRGGLFSLPLDFGAGQFAGDAQWLEIAVRPAGGGAFVALVPRTPVTATPYALAAINALGDSVTGSSIVDGSVGSADINSAEVQRRLSGSCPSGQYLRVVSESGAVTCGSDANSGGTVVSIAAGVGLTGGPITSTGTLSVAAGGIGTTQINSTQVQRRVSGSCPAGQYVRIINEAGTVTCGTDSVGTPGWGLGGNAGTDPATNFIGTTDAQSFVVRTANSPSLRIEPSSVMFAGAPITSNLIAGSSSNRAVPGVRGATISGGGVPAGPSDPLLLNEAPNQVFSSYGSIGGGYSNSAGDIDGSVNQNLFTTVGGGGRNTASAAASTVGGGFANRASGNSSTVGGGSQSTASGLLSTVGGGDRNNASGSWSTVGGGLFNMASTTYSTVGGGTGNSALGFGSTVSGGVGGEAAGLQSTVAGGSLNCAGGATSWVGGLRAKVRPAADPGSGGACSGLTYPGGDGDQGSFVWADSLDADFTSTGPNQFLIRSAGGVAINTNAPRAPLTVTTENQWNPTIGTGWGDFTVGDATRGLAVGVSTGGGGAGSVRLWAKGGAENISFTNATLYPAQLLHIGGDGRVGVGRIAAANAFEVNGSASKSTAGDWLSNSDARIKTDVAEIESPLERLLRLRPVTFRYTDGYLAERPAIDDVEYYNVIAQEYAEVFPDAVKRSGEYLPGQPHTPENAVLQVDFHPASVLTVAAVQELAVRLADVEAENVALRARLARIEARLGD